ncbi:Neurotrypsin [Mactra antiquata]
MAGLSVSYWILLSLLVCVVYSQGQTGHYTVNTKKDSSDRSINEIKEDITMPPNFESSPTIQNELTAGPDKTDDTFTVFTTETPKNKVSKDESTNVPSTKPSEQPTKSSTTTKTTTTPQPTTSRKESLDPTDRYLLDGLLDIVDEKFSTLSKRLMTLERGVNNLQYYNVRSFRVVNTHLHAVDTILHTMHSQVNQIEENGKVFEQVIGAVKDEVIDLQTMNSGMFQAIEQNLIHFHTDLAAKINDVKDNIESTNGNLKQLTNETGGIKDQVEIVKQSQDDLYQNAAANAVITSELLENSLTSINIVTNTANELKDSMKISKEINTTLMDITKSVSAITVGTFEIKQSVESALSNISIATVEGEEMDEANNYLEFKSKNSRTHLTCGKLLEALDEKLKNITIVNVDNNKKSKDTQPTKSIDSKEFKNQTRKLMRALSTVNENIYQSVTLYRHTGNLIERVIADTEQIATEQVRLREELLSYLMNGTFDLFNQSLPDMAAIIASRQEEPVKIKNGSQCTMSKSFVDELLKLSFNGSQIIELLTELATTSTSSINTSIEKLNLEISRLVKAQTIPLSPPVNTKPDIFIRDDPKAGGNSQLRDILNRTDMIYTFVEAIASNTGWIPYIFHNVRFVESQMNKTLKSVKTLDTRSEEMLLRQRANMAIMFKPKEFLKDPSTTTTTAQPIVDKKAKGNNGKDNDDKTYSYDFAEPTNQSSIFSHMMDFVYRTNIKLNRLIPALTNLLGEPEPYIALVGGDTDREGRVEVYHKGQWGTLTGSLGHVEASYVCRKLGYLGGVSVGNGYFGAGSGQFWDLNVTCLRTRWCHAVTHAINQDTHSHSQDVGVLCDHMVRMTQTNDDEEEEVMRHVGRLEIYHQNTWLPVCYSGWGRVETGVACQQLGFREGAATPVKDETIVDSHWMVNVTCSGNENRLDACAYSGFQYNGCPDSEYVSLICS